jgi:hypothetical protein
MTRCARWRHPVQGPCSRTPRSAACNTMWTALRRLATGLAVSLCAPRPTAAQAAPAWVPGTYRVVVYPSGACQTAAALRRATHGILVLGSAADFAFLSDSAHAILRTEWDMGPLNGCLEWVAVARHDASYAGANPQVGVDGARSPPHVRSRLRRTIQRTHRTA